MPSASASRVTSWAEALRNAPSPGRTLSRSTNVARSSLSSVISETPVGGECGRGRRHQQQGQDRTVHRSPFSATTCVSGSGPSTMSSAARRRKPWSSSDKLDHQLVLASLSKPVPDGCRRQAVEGPQFVFCCRRGSPFDWVRANGVLSVEDRPGQVVAAASAGLSRASSGSAPAPARRPRRRRRPARAGSAPCRRSPGP